jgi:hypothetical protein
VLPVMERRHGVDVGVAQADGVVKDGVGLEQRGLSEDGEDHALGELELGEQGGVDAGAQVLIFEQESGWSCVVRGLTLCRAIGSQLDGRSVPRPAGQFKAPKNRRPKAPH